MKSKHLISLLLVLVMVFAIAAAGCSPAAAPTPAATPVPTAAPTKAPDPTPDAPKVEPKMKYTTANGNNYSWKPAGIYLTAGADRVMIDYFCYMLKHTLETKDGVIFVAMDDLQTIYAPDFTVAKNGNKLTVTHAAVTAEIEIGSKAMTAYTGAATLEAAPYESNGVVFVPFLDFMVKGFGKIQSNSGIYYGLGNNADFVVNNTHVYNLKMFFRGKNVGKSYWAYWNEEVGRLESVVVYIPSTYDASKPNKMIVQLHGAGGNAVSIPDGTKGPDMMEMAEKYGYIVMWPESYYQLGNFGMWVQPAGQKPITAATDPKNPAGYTEAQLADIKLAGHNVQKAMDFVESKWSVNEDNVFIMGISMGGCGTWFQASEYADRFAACSPSGAFVEPAFFDWSTITIPTYYVGGTEDRNGFDLMLKAYDIAMSQGANIVKFDVVGGAPHGGEWTQRLTEVYDFFDSYCK